MRDKTPSDDKSRIFLPALLLVWIVSALLALAALAYFERQRLAGELAAQSSALHGLASQRADQHDAHLTALSAIFVAGGVGGQDLFLEVSDTIRRFYDRIAAMAVVSYDGATAVMETQPPLSQSEARMIRDLAQASDGALQIGQSPDRPSHYLLVKRTPNTDAARHGLGLVIDAQALIATDDPFWQRPSASRLLRMPDGTILTGTPGQGGLSLTRMLGSASQPLLLETALAVGLADLLPLRQALAVLAALTLVLMALALGLRQRARTAAAEARARFSAQETRLAHASRVNALGEMASGMAHELAQPLTAILSQAQAGRHLARRGDTERLAEVLQDMIAQAARASRILERLRRWSKPNREPNTAVALNDAARGVERLLSAEARGLGASISLDLASDALRVNADPVEIEQVIFNLVRNALDAQPGAEIAIRTAVEQGQAVLTVTDRGPGIPPELRPRIFEPFVTGKPGGTGLGLALCRRIVEELDGEISLMPEPGLTVFRVVLPLSASKENA